MADKNRDPESSPGTAAFTPDFDDDTGTHSWAPDFDDDTGSQPVPAVTEPDKAAQAAQAAQAAPAGESGPEPAPEHTPVQSVTVPGRYQYLKWWKLLLVLFGVWAAAAEVGLSLFYWWYHTTDKTLAAYTALVYVVTCVVAAVMLAMVQGRPVVSALSLAVMSGPFASVVAAAPLYGYYHCERIGHCLVGVIPY